MKYLVANWKANPTTEEAAVALALQAEAGFDGLAGVKSIICPPFLYLSAVRSALRNSRLGAQDISRFKTGAHTGEVSADMLADFKTEYAIIGHSERVMALGEDLEVLNVKMKLAKEAGLTPILCLGAGSAQGDDGAKIKRLVRDQYNRALQGLTLERLVLAYEPTWAISTQGGAAPTAQHVAEISAFIRTLPDEEQVADFVVLYGGSVSSNNATDYAMVDGFLLGSASLDAAEYIEIAKILANHE